MRTTVSHPIRVLSLLIATTTLIAPDARSSELSPDSLNVATRGAEIVYDNTTTFAGAHNVLLGMGMSDSTEHGNGITLAGAGRTATELQVYLGVACCGVASLDAQVRFYANDGTGGAPGTLLWESDPQPVILDSGNPDPIPLVQFFSVPNIVVPDTFTWTVQLTDRTGNMAMLGPSEFDPPTVGSAPFGFWRRTGPNDWEFTGAGEPPFGARLTVGPGDSVPAASTWGLIVMFLTMLMAASIVLRRQASDRA